MTPTLLIYFNLGYWIDEIVCENQCMLARTGFLVLFFSGTCLRYNTSNTTRAHSDVPLHPGLSESTRSTGRKSPCLSYPLSPPDALSCVTRISTYPPSYHS